MRTFVVAAASVAVLGSSQASATAQEIALQVDKHARLTADGAVVITVRVTCGPLPGTEDFREATAGAGQAKTGAAAEGGLDGSVVCDGQTRTHVARLAPFTETVFTRGPAVANVSVIACNVADEEQVCVSASASRRIVIAGRQLP
jgi:hypothetical protein